jgi:hypothetical protein
MEDSMSTRVAVVTTFLVALAVVPGRINSGLTAQTPPATSSGQQSTTTMQDMTRMHEQMMAQMKAGDARLDALVKEMNSAKGESKVDAVAAVVTELINQHKAMHGHMGQMHQMMMGGRGMMMKK